MKCPLGKEMYGLPETDPRYAEVQAHLRGCFMCRARWDDQEAVRQLMALKRYEQPAPNREARTLAAIHTRVAAQWAAAGWWQNALTRWYDERFQPVRLTLAAAAVLLLLGGGYYLVQPLGSSGPARPAPALALEDQRPRPRPDSPAPAVTGLPPMLIAASNREPARMDYGPGPSMPVKYDY